MCGGGGGGWLGKMWGLFYFTKTDINAQEEFGYLMAWGNMSGDWMFLIIYLKSLV